MSHQFGNKTYNGFWDSFTGHFNEMAIGAGEFLAFSTWMIIGMIIIGVLIVGVLVAAKFLEDGNYV